MIVDGLTVHEYLVTNLQPGLIYTFKVVGRNVQYWGDDSVELPILAA